ncbi:MAG: M14 family zinc carboxypeptidase [bacterium]
MIRFHNNSTNSMFESLIENTEIRFTTCDEFRPQIKAACSSNPDIAAYHEIGKSEAGRRIDVVILGHGAQRVSLIAGAHSDEPVGPETLRTFLLNSIRHKDRLKELFITFQFLVVPHINPDGEARNQGWIKKWPHVEAYLEGVFRELPGRDLEFGFPAMRPENRHVSQFLRENGPVAMHASLHSMSFSEGAFLLIERHWIERTQQLRKKFARAALDFGLNLHDHDRHGEKGFHYIEAGFTTTPEGQAMRRFFKNKGDAEMAALFHDSSMEFVRQLGGDPLCLVTELPLFVINKKRKNSPAGIPESYLAFKDKIPELRIRLQQNRSIAETIAEFEITPLDLATASKLQLRAIQLGLETISHA